MEGCRIQKRTDEIFGEIEDAKEYKYDHNKLSAKNLSVKHTDKENNGKNKLRSKFCYKDSIKADEGFVEVIINEHISQNYYTYNPKTERKFEVNEFNISSDNIKNDNIDLVIFKDQEGKKNNKEEIIGPSESFREHFGKSIRKSDFERTKYHSEKILSHREKYDFSNIKEIIEKKLKNKNDHKKLMNISGDITKVPSISFYIGKHLENINQVRKGENLISNSEKADSNFNTIYKCNTHRNEIPKDLENDFNKNFEPLDRNEAVTVRTKEFVNQFDSNKFLMNGNELIMRDSIRNVSSQESYYEFKNNMNINQDNKNNQIPKINNEYIRNEATHQTIQSPKNKRNSMLHADLNFDLDFVISTENLSSKGYFRIETNNNSVIKLPDNYWTKDIDRKILVDLINENPNAKWEKIKVDPNIKIYKKKIENNPSILIKTIATLNDFSKEEIFNAIANVDIRKQWDTLFSEFKIVETNNEEKTEVLYMSLKSPFPLVERRDFVQKRKIWRDFPDKNSVCIHFKSIDHPDCPLYKKIVRAHTHISGYFIKTESLNPPKCSIYIVSQTDAKGKIPIWIVNKASQTAPNDWVNNLIRGCKMVRDKKIL